MERNSLIYKLRRKCQVAANKILPKKAMCNLYSRVVLKKSVNLSNPKTFNEKIQWCKLYYYPKNPLIVKCADKYEVRQYVKEKGLEHTLVPLLGVWNNAKDIDWNALPERFVLKCNHGCAYNILCPEKATFDTEAAKRQLNKWLKEDFGAYNIELHYSKISPRITCEEYLGDCITDYKFFCFGGKPEFIYVSNDLVHDRQAQIGFFYLNGEKMPLKRDDYTEIASARFPPFFEQMRRDAETLSKDFPFVRVDFFIANNRYYFAELTFTPSAGMMPFNPEKYDLLWGNKIDLSGILPNT